MTPEQKSEFLAQISLLLDKMIDKAAPKEKRDYEPCEMLTIKECSTVVKGLSEHTIRLLVTKGELASVRTGAGKRGKILIPKSSLLDYINKIQAKTN